MGWLANHAPTAGAVISLTIYSCAIMVFIARLLRAPRLESWAGLLRISTAVPLAMLIAVAPRASRPLIYYVQLSLMVGYLLTTLIVDHILFLEFRTNLRYVIAYVMLFFGASGGMLGVASLAGQRWLIAALVLFFIMAVLAFVQRAVTGK